MTKSERIAIFVTALLVLGAVLVLFWNPISSYGSSAIVIFSALIMLSFTATLAEHYFTRPTDVVASTLGVLLLISPVHALLSEMGMWYWTLWSYSAALLVISLLALLLADQTRSPAAWGNRAAAALYRVAVTFGSGRLVWLFVFVAATFFYIDNQSPLFVALVVYAGLLLAIDTRAVLKLFQRRRVDRDEAIAEIFSVQSDRTYLARVFEDAGRVRRYDVVGFLSKEVRGGAWTTGLVLDTYQLNRQRWLRILTSPSFAELHEKTVAPESPRNGSVYRLSPTAPIATLESLVGTICEGSEIAAIKFEYAFQVPIEEGELVEIETREQRVLYQVVEGITQTEPLESKDEAGMIVGEAVQLGVWNGTSRRFDRFGWVPVMTSPVLKASTIEAPAPAPDEYRIGMVPGTNFPVFVDLDAAVTHHTAVLGVTGSGKSVFARNLVRQISAHGTKVICVDFTNEYSQKLSDLIAGTLIDEKLGEKMFAAIDEIGAEMDEFPNKRNKPRIAECEEVLSEGFCEAIRQFVSDDRKALLFELPDVTNSTGILEYTKWFFKSLFKLAKANEFGERKVCVVLEEAHTVVPEWNFLGVEDKRSSTVVNSISQIALQGRKYGVGFIVIAQRTANVSKTVLTQCNSVVAFQQFDKTSAEFLGNYMGADYLGTLTRLKSRHAIAVGKAFSSGTPMIFQVPEIVEPA